MMAEAGNLGIMLVDLLRRISSNEELCDNLHVWPYLESHVIAAEGSFAAALQTN
jgi:hypothetical protein